MTSFLLTMTIFCFIYTRGIIRKSYLRTCYGLTDTARPCFGLQLTFALGFKGMTTAYENLFVGQKEEQI